MGNLFNNLTTDGLEENEDRVGGFGRLETGVYEGKIKVAYAGQSDGGARSVSLVADLGGQEYRETFWITNKNGENFFTNKDKKKIALPGFTTIDDICQVTCDKVLAEMDAEEKVINLYDYDQKKEVPTAVPVLVELTGKDILVAVNKNLEDKRERTAAGDYVPTGEHRETNTIEKVFHPELRVTVVEAKNGRPAEFIGVWEERNKGKVRDKRQNKGGEVKTGRPGQNSGPPQAGNSGARKSLFGNRAA